MSVYSMIAPIIVPLRSSRHVHDVGTLTSMEAFVAVAVMIMAFAFVMWLTFTLVSWLWPILGEKPPTLIEVLRVQRHWLSILIRTGRVPSTKGKGQ